MSQYKNAIYYTPTQTKNHGSKALVKRVVVDGVKTLYNVSNQENIDRCFVTLSSDIIIIGVIGYLKQVDSKYKS